MRSLHEQCWYELLSLHNYHGAFADSSRFVGLANHTKFTSDPLFQESLVHTLH